jgi:general secretion pathway protein K
MTTLPLNICRERAAQRGSALIMVFWLIAMLTMVIYSMHAIVSHDLELTISQKQAFRTRQLADAGVNWAMNPSVKKYDRKILEQAGGNSIIPMEADESIYVRIRGEGGRMNINAMLQNDAGHRTIATNLFHLWGLENDEADTLFDCMLDWIDADDEKQAKGMEKKDYLELFQTDQTPYPFNRPFYNLDEMLLVPGFDRVVANVPDWRDYFTIYSTGKLDVNEAEPKVLAAAACACEDRAPDQEMFARKLGKAEEFVQEKFGADGIEDTEDDSKLEAPAACLALEIDENSPKVQLLIGGTDQTVHIECVATVGDYRKRVVLVVRNRTGNPQILAREEVPLFQ